MAKKPDNRNPPPRGVVTPNSVGRPEGEDAEWNDEDEEKSESVLDKLKNVGHKVADALHLSHDTSAPESVSSQPSITSATTHTVASGLVKTVPPPSEPNEPGKTSDGLPLSRVPGKLRKTLTGDNN